MVWMGTYVEIPLSILKRFPLYIRLLREYRDREEPWISSADIARRLGLKDIQVRKDLACTGVAGAPRRGFPVNELLKAVDYYLGGDNYSDIFLVGAGPRGLALLDDEGIAAHGFKITAVFDASPELVGAKAGRLTVLPLEKLENLVGRMGVKLAVLAVPEKDVQAFADRLVDAGVKGIWCFSSVYVKHPKDVMVLQEDLGARLALLAGEVSKYEKDRIPAD